MILFTQKQHKIKRNSSYTPVSLLRFKFDIFIVLVSFGRLIDLIV